MLESAEMGVGIECEGGVAIVVQFVPLKQPFWGALESQGQGSSTIACQYLWRFT